MTKGMTLIDIMRDAHAELWHGYGRLYDGLSLEDRAEIDKFCHFENAGPYMGLQEVPKGQDDGIDL
jgi:hypothetical protein